MRRFSRFFLIFAAGAALVSISAFAENDYRVCRNVHGVRECIGFSPGCKGGVYRLEGKERKQCQELSARRCEAIEAMFKSRFDDLKALSAKDRDLEPRLGVECDAFTLRIPEHSVAACIGAQRKGSAGIFDLLKAVQGVCDE